MQTTSLQKTTVFVILYRLRLRQWLRGSSGKASVTTDSSAALDETSAPTPDMCSRQCTIWLRYISLHLWNFILKLTRLKSMPLKHPLLKPIRNWGGSIKTYRSRVSRPEPWSNALITGEMYQKQKNQTSTQSATCSMVKITKYYHLQFKRNADWHKDWMLSWQVTADMSDEINQSRQGAQGDRGGPYFDHLTLPL